MSVTVRHKGKVAIVDVHGKLAVGAEVQLRDTVLKLLEDGGRLFLFNLFRVPFIDSVGLGEVVACTKRICERDGGVKLVLAPRGKPIEIFRITGLDRAYDIHHDEEEALASWIP